MDECESYRTGGPSFCQPDLESGGERRRIQRLPLCRKRGSIHKDCQRHNRRVHRLRRQSATSLGGYEDTSTEAIAAAAGYAGARGSGSMQPAPNAATVLASGVNVQNILSQGIAPNFQNLSDTQLANKL